MNIDSKNLEPKVAELIIRTLDDPLILCDATGTVKMVNESFSSTFGHSQESIHGRSLFSLKHAENRGIAEALSRFTEVNNKEAVLFNNKDEPIDVSISLKRLTQEDGGLGGAVVILKDIRKAKAAQAMLEAANKEMEKRIEERTVRLSEANQLLLNEIKERKSIEISLRESEYRYALAAQGANDGLWDWNLNIGDVYFSPRFKAILGYAESEIGISPDEWFSRIHPDDAERVAFELKEHMEDRLAYFSSEHRILMKSGEYCWVLARGLAVKDPEGQVYRIAGSLTDISHRKRTEEKLIFDASHDTLTGLQNRTMLSERIKLLINKQRHRGGKTFAVLFLDLDRFKLINDTYGHLAGDTILVNTAERLKKCLRDVDTVVRLGGDEFVVLMEDVEDIKVAIAAAVRIQAAVQRPFTINEKDVFTSVSIGIVLSTSSHNTPEEIIRDADIALFKAKYLGRAQYAVFDPVMQQESAQQMELEKDLREAIGQENFSLYYQPIVSLTNETIIGFEALLRWKHPEKGFIDPEVFIPLAEDNDLILPLGKWVLRRACTDMASWLAKFGPGLPYSVSVNISGKQLKSIQLVEDVSSALAEAGLDPGHLVLEITESAIIKDLNTALSILLKVKEMGVRLHLDDFGQGYSSINLLHKLPFDTMKIDRSFVSGIAANSINRDVVKTIINLGHTMHKKVIAEGIEEAGEADALKDFSCENGQGYYYAKPMDKNDLETYILSQFKEA